MIIDNLTKLCKCERRDCCNFFLLKQGSTGKYCCQSCSASENNFKTPKRKRDDSNLIHVGFTPSGRRVYKKQCLDSKCSKLINSESTYCIAHYKENSLKTPEKWLDGQWDGCVKSGLSNVIRKYLLEQANYTCRCGFNTRHPIDNSCILEIDHINGKSNDNRPENLQVLCPNCHALTPTYRARNMGSGRSSRYN